MPGSPLHIILFAYNFPPINTSGAQRPVRFWKYLPENDVVAHVVCSSSAGVNQEMSNVHHVPMDNALSWKLRMQNAGAHAAQRIIPHNERMTWVPSAVEAAEQIRARHPVSAVLSTFPPLGTHLAAGWFAAHNQLKWVADFRDNIVGNPFRQRDKGLQHEPFFERLVFERAHLLTTVTDGIVEEWCERFPQYRSKMRVLWNGFDPEEPFPAIAPVSRARRVLAHVGLIYGQRHPQLLLASIERLVRNGRLDPNSFRIELTGPLDEPPTVRPVASFTTLLEAGCLEAHGPVPRSEAVRRIAEADQLLVIDVNALGATHAAPAKLFDYLRAGRPILGIVQPNSIVERIITRSEAMCAFIYPDEAATVTDAKVLKFLEQPAAYVRPSAWFWDTFDGRKQAAQLAEMIRSL